MNDSSNWQNLLKLVNYDLEFMFGQGRMYTIGNTSETGRIYRNIENRLGSGTIFPVSPTYNLNLA